MNRIIGKISRQGASAIGDSTQRQALCAETLKK
jgi:hypothetical protein